MVSTIASACSRIACSAILLFQLIVSTILQLIDDAPIHQPVVVIRGGTQRLDGLSESVKQFP